MESQFKSLVDSNDCQIKFKNEVQIEEKKILKENKNDLTKLKTKTNKRPIVYEDLINDIFNQNKKKIKN